MAQTESCPQASHHSVDNIMLKYIIKQVTSDFSSLMIFYTEQLKQGSNRKSAETNELVDYDTVKDWDQ